MALEYTIAYADFKNFEENNVGLWVGSQNIGEKLGTIWTNDILEFRAKSGYKFEVQPILHLKSGRQYKFDIINPQLATLKAPNGSTGSGYSNFTVKTVSDAPVIPAYTFTADDILLFVAKNITGVIGDNTAVGTGVVLNVGDKLTLTTARDYYFEYAQAYTLGGMVDPFTINTDKTSAVYTPTDELQGIDFDTEFKAFEAFKVTQKHLDDFKDKSVNGFINDKPMAVDDVILIDDNIKFVCEGRGVVFDGVNINYGSNRVETMTVASDKITATFKWVKREKINRFDIYTIDKFPVVYTFDAENYKYFTDRNSKPFANGVELKLGDKYHKGDLIEIKTNKGYEFITGEKVQVVSYLTYSLDINPTRTVATIEWARADTIYNFEFTTVKTAIVDTDTTNNTYQITPRELRNLESLVLKEWNVDGEMIADYSNLLVGVMRYPFAIPDDFKGGYGGIYIGHKQYDKVKATDVTVDMLEVDLGSIKVDPKFNDLRDYANTDAILRLPHLESVKLDLEYVIGQTVGVKYVVNLINGETTVIISSSKLPEDNNTLLTLSATLGTPIPIAHKDGFEYQPIDAQGLRLGGINYIDKPTIDIVRNDQVNKDSMFTIPVKDSGKLTDFTGWTKIDDIVLTLNATQQEKQEIVSLLKTGVYFNE